MSIKDIILENLKPEQKRCILFANDGNTVIKKKKSLYCVENLTHKKEHFWSYMEKNENGDYTIFNCLGDICIKCGNISQDFDFGKFEESITNYPYSGVDGFINMLDKKEGEGEYINKLEIEACYLIGRVDLFINYKKYREDYIAAMERKKRAEREVEERKREEKEAREQEEIEIKIKEAESFIKNQRELKNFQINGSTIILALMKKYGVKVPLRTQGWINKSLSRILFDDKRITYTYYKTSKDSKAFYGCLLELERKILE